MNDDQMDELLIHGVRDYNLPGAVPREEMWNRVRDARSAKRNEGRRTRVRVWASMGVAAALILSVGIVIGRRMDPATAVAVTPSVVTPDSNAAGARQPSGTDTLIRQLHQETQKTDRRVAELTSTEAPRTPGNATERSLTYRLVVLRHLAGSEAMITSFRASARHGELDAQIAAWSKELLSTTRMLEASQADDDPYMKRLLEDLDLVITQIVQYTTKGVTNTEELDLIERSINRRGVMTELRSTVPAAMRRSS